MRVLVKWVKTGTYCWKKSTGSKAGQLLQMILVYLNQMRPLWPEPYQTLVQATEHCTPFQQNGIRV